MSTVVFGIKNCDTIKKARRWLEQQNVNYQFSDFREEQPTTECIHGWVETLGLDTLVNKRSTTYRQLDPSMQQSQDIDTWVKLIQDQPTLIKRPLLQHQDKLYCGFKEVTYKGIFNV